MTLSMCALRSGCFSWEKRRDRDRYTKTQTDTESRGRDRDRNINRETERDRDRHLVLAEPVPTRLLHKEDGFSLKSCTQREHLLLILTVAFYCILLASSWAQGPPALFREWLLTPVTWQDTNSSSKTCNPEGEKAPHPFSSPGSKHREDHKKSNYCCNSRAGSGWGSPRPSIIAFVSAT